MYVWTFGNHKKLLASNIRRHKQYHRKPHAAWMQPPSSPARRAIQQGGTEAGPIKIFGFGSSFSGSVGGLASFGNDP